jgi:hypothetical protein
MYARSGIGTNGDRRHHPGRASRLTCRTAVPHNHGRTTTATTAPTVTNVGAIVGL